MTKHLADQRAHRCIVELERLDASAEHDPVGLVVDAMERQGFEPVVRRARGDRIDVVLQTCPFESAALTGNRVVVDELVRHDPRRANCRLRMHLEPAES